MKEFLKIAAMESVKDWMCFYREIHKTTIVCYALLWEAVIDRVSPYERDETASETVERLEAEIEEE